MEQIITGYLTELNGKYKLRVTETTYAPGGFIGEHHHGGPGIRYVVSVQLTYAQTDTIRTFNTGDYFYESGDVSHTAYNKTKEKVIILNYCQLTGKALLQSQFLKSSEQVKHLYLIMLGPINFILRPVGELLT